MTNSDKAFPGISLPTHIPLDEDVHPSLKGVNAYIDMEEMGERPLTELKKIAKSDDENAGRELLKCLSKYFIEGKLPGKDKKLFSLSKEHFASGLIPMKIINEVVAVMMGMKLPKVQKPASEK